MAYLHPQLFVGRQSPPWGCEPAGEGFWLTPPPGMTDEEASALTAQHEIVIEHSKLTPSGTRKHFVFEFRNER